jgi:hypothetical protein
LAPFAGLAEAGCSAAAGGSGAVAHSAAACGSAHENSTQRRMWKKAADFCGEKAFDDLGLGASAGTGNLEDSLVESGQRVAADGAALASLLVLSLLAVAVLSSTVWDASWMDISWDAEAALNFAFRWRHTAQTQRRQDLSYFSHSVFKKAAIIEAQCFDIVCQWMKEIKRVCGFSTVRHHTVFAWLIDFIRLSSNLQIQLKCIRVLRTINGVAVYIHFLKSCWSDWVD